MSLSSRQRWLVALLPAMLLAGLYLLAVRPAMKERLTTAEHRLATLGGAPEAKPGAGASAEAIAGALEEKRALEARARSLPCRWARPDQLAATVRELSAAFQREGVRVQSSRPEPDESAPKLAQGLRDLKQSLHDLGEGEPRLWRLELYGSYESILRGLEAFPGNTPFGLPVTIAATLGAGHDLNFTLWFWI
jgi:hypothetical protein